MPHFFVDEEIESKEYSLFGEDGRHISKSLRMNKGESLTLCSPSGTVHNCVVEEINGDMVKVNVLWLKPQLHRECWECGYHLDPIETKERPKNQRQYR